MAVKQEIDNTGKVGVEFDHINLENFNKLGDALPNVERVDIGKAAMTMRMVKSDEEIELIKNGTAISDEGGAACVEAMAEGVP